MYPEFIPIYIGLLIIIVLLVIILILIIKRTENSASIQKKITNVNMVQKEPGNIVFCKSCATQYNAAQHSCPKCGTPR